MKSSDGGGEGRNAHTCVFAPIGDLASVAAWRLDGHPYAGAAEEILRATNSG